MTNEANVLTSAEKGPVFVWMNDQCGSIVSLGQQT